MMSRNYCFFRVDSSLFEDIVDTNDINYKDIFNNVREVGAALYRDIESGKLLEIERISNRLDQKQIYEEEREKHFGKNKIIVGERKTFWEILWKNMQDKMLLLLFIGSIISLLIGIYNFIFEGDKYGYVDGLSILFAIVVIVAMGTLNEYKQERLFKSLEKKKSDLIIKYIEDGMYKTKKISQILVGDLLYVEPGDILPVDAILVSEGTLFVDESLLTGESDSVKKNEKNPILRSGSCVLEGAGKCLVVCVGHNTTKGKLLKSMVKPKKQTPLEYKSGLLANELAKQALGVSFVLFGLHILRVYIFGGTITLTYVVKKAVETIALAVMIIPEGLPMSTTMALSFGTKRMLKDNNLVRDVSACEKMNNVRFLCTDKTGTLTYNRLRLRHTYIKRKSSVVAVHVKDALYTGEKYNHERIIDNIVFNSSAFKNQEGVYVGSRIESTLLTILEKMNVDVLSMRKERKVLCRLPFSSQRKYMATIIENKNFESKSNLHGSAEDVQEEINSEDFVEVEAPPAIYEDQKDGEYMVLIKGATEKIIEHCKYEIINGLKVKIDVHRILKYLKKQNKICQRTIALAFANIPEPKQEYLKIKNNKDFIFLGCFSFEDSLREGIERKIELMKDAGLNIVMLTGDCLDTAIHVAEDIGILYDKHETISGKEFREMPDEELMKKIENIRVIARASPSDKKRFVEFLQKKGEVVAVTGDGANDGPALRLADVGFSMGLSATDVAKEASSIIILDENFDSIIKSIAWGRCINDAIRKFLQLQLTVTISIVVLIVFSSVLTFRNTALFSPLQLLWINLYMDAFSAISLSSDKPTITHLKRMPENPENRLITKQMKLFIFYSTLYILMVTLFLYFSDFSRTFIFNVFFLMIVATQINARSLSSNISPFSNITRNNYFMIVNAIVLLFQLFIIQKLNIVFHTEPLSIGMWMASFGLGFSLLAYFSIIRYLDNFREKKRISKWNNSLRGSGLLGS